MGFITKVCQCLDKHQVPYAIVGGYAVALHGASRGTVDLDLMIRFRERDFTELETALKEIGLQPRLPVTAREVFNFRQEYIENRNLIAWSFINPNNLFEWVDVIITDNLEDVSIVDKQINSQTVHVLSKKDLIAMKKRAGREQDLLDVKALEQT